MQGRVIPTVEMVKQKHLAKNSRIPWAAFDYITRINMMSTEGDLRCHEWAFNERHKGKPEFTAKMKKEIKGNRKVRNYLKIHAKHALLKMQKSLNQAKEYRETHTTKEFIQYIHDDILKKKLCCVHLPKAISCTTPEGYLVLHPMFYHRITGSAVYEDPALAQQNQLHGRINLMMNHRDDKLFTMPESPLHMGTVLEEVCENQKLSQNLIELINALTIDPFWERVSFVYGDTIRRNTLDEIYRSIYALVTVDVDHYDTVLINTAGRICNKKFNVENLLLDLYATAYEALRILYVCKTNSNREFFANRELFKEDEPIIQSMKRALAIRLAGAMITFSGAMTPQILREIENERGCRQIALFGKASNVNAFAPILKEEKIPQDVIDVAVQFLDHVPEYLRPMPDRQEEVIQYIYEDFKPIEAPKDAPSLKELEDQLAEAVEKDKEKLLNDHE